MQVNPQKKKRKAYGVVHLGEESAKPNFVPADNILNFDSFPLYLTFYSIFEISN